MPRTLENQRDDLLSGPYLHGRPNKTALYPRNNPSHLPLAAPRSTHHTGNATQLHARPSLFPRLRAFPRGPAILHKPRKGLPPARSLPSHLSPASQPQPLLVGSSLWPSHLILWVGVLQSQHIRRSFFPKDQVSYFFQADVQ